MGHTIPDAFAEAARVLDLLRRDSALLGRIAAAATTLAETLREGHKILICGNGGSSCDAMHFAEELTGRFRADRRPLAAIACTDFGHITCTANDYGFEYVYSRWVEALAQPGDALILLSTSGNSPNIRRAARSARERSVTTIGVLGKGGGDVAQLCEHALVFPGDTSDRIQELHMLTLHAWVEAIEASLHS